MTTHPLSQGNRFQRAYYAWAAPHYARMKPGLREQAELIDAFLYSRRGAGAWLGMVGAVAGTCLGLTSAGMPLLLALALSLILWIALPLMALGAWLQPERFGSQQIRKFLPRFIALGLAGALLGFAVGHVAKHGDLEFSRLLLSLRSALGVLVPVVAGIFIGLTALLWAVAQMRRLILERELERVTLAAERDAAARQVSEAQLKLLQGQIQPHFIFNTLSALQHWVDTQDRRAGPLLQSLTSFLRGSTELLGRDTVTLEVEAATVAHYLAIQQARLGPRLTSGIDISPHAATMLLPPGVLLTLVENAVEHGIAPALTGGDVCVAAWREDGQWVLTVRDSGAGLAEAWHDGVGLANCRQRLQHHFGSRAALTLSARQPGTEARLVIEDAPA